MYGRKSKVAVLWSGGFDSTVMVYLLASKGYTVKPYHIFIRGGGGKDFREKQAIDEIWANLEGLYTKVEEPTHIRKVIKKCDDRNQKMIQIVRDEFKEEVIALGSYKEGSRFVKDNDKTYLSYVTGCKILTFDSFGVKNKQEIASLVKGLKLEESIKKAWSCQLWFKTPCGKCFSCKQRAQADGIIE
ncbi:hypothetical protein FJZ53_03975 [Candidatus Woesearchaeota archaeon]|nr:hypothetical protein [Candidatus Woesearchaeota archaeon]